MKALSIKTRRGRASLKDVLARVDEEVQLLHEHLGGLPRAVEDDHILKEIWLDDVHNSTAIEGNTMTRAQVEDLVVRRLPSATLLESVEVDAYARASDWVYRHAVDYKGVPTSVVSEVHKILMEATWAIEPPATHDQPGAWRRGGVRVGALRVSLPAAIPADLQAWAASTMKQPIMHPIAAAAHHHAWIERIHPFVDGNGRVGRLLLNFMLIQRGYPPAVILASQRKRYLGALRAADTGNAKPLADVIARAVSGALTRFLIPNLAGDAKLVPLSALSHKSVYSANYLKILATRGKLRVVRDGRLLLSSRAWLAEYVKGRDPRGGQPARRAAQGTTG